MAKKIVNSDLLIAEVIKGIEDVKGENISIIDSGKAVAKQVKSILYTQGKFSTNKSSINEFYTNSTTDVIRTILNNDYPIYKLDF